MSTLSVTTQVTIQSPISPRESSRSGFTDMLAASALTALASMPAIASSSSSHSEAAITSSKRTRSGGEVTYGAPQEKSRKTTRASTVADLRKEVQDLQNKLTNAEKRVETAVSQRDQARSLARNSSSACLDCPTLRNEKSALEQQVRDRQQELKNATDGHAMQRSMLIGQSQGMMDMVQESEARGARVKTDLEAVKGNNEVLRERVGLLESQLVRFGQFYDMKIAEANANLYQSNQTVQDLTAELSDLRRESELAIESRDSTIDDLQRRLTFAREQNSASNLLLRNFYRTSVPPPPPRRSAILPAASVAASEFSYRSSAPPPPPRLPAILPAASVAASEFSYRTSAPPPPRLPAILPAASVAASEFSQLYSSLTGQQLDLSHLSVPEFSRPLESTR